MGTLKRLYSFMLVLFISMGWGLTRPSLGRDILLRAFGASMIYFITSIAHEVVVFFRESLLLNMRFLALSSLPVTSWYTVTFYWILSELNDTMAILTKRHRIVQLNQFRRFRALIF